LCINADDRDSLLNASAWPDSVLISDWYFKPAAEQQGNDKRRRVGSQSNAAASATTAATQAAPTDTVTASVVAVLRDDNDDTIVVTDMGCDDGDDNQLRAEDHLIQYARFSPRMPGAERYN